MTHHEPNISLSGTAALCHHTSFFTSCMLCYSERTMLEEEHEHELAKERVCAGQSRSCEAEPRQSSRRRERRRSWAFRPSFLSIMAPQLSQSLNDFCLRQQIAIPRSFALSGS